MKKAVKRISPFETIRTYLESPEKYADGVKLVETYLPQNPGFIANLKEGENPERKKMLISCLQRFLTQHNSRSK